MNKKKKISNFVFMVRYYISNLFFSKIRVFFELNRQGDRLLQWGEIRKTYANQDTWLVIGNGPSLKLEDIEALSHIPSIASNKIGLLYEGTRWRPTLYTVADPLLIYKLPRRHYDSIPLCLISNRVFHMARTQAKLSWFSKSLAEGERWYEKLNSIPDPIVSGFIGTATITTINLQLAMWCGAKVIYLIGCDHNYIEEQHSEVKKLIHKNNSNHFHPSYRREGEIVNNAETSKMEREYELIQLIAVEHNIKIINISRKTALTKFECASVEEAVARTSTC